MCWRFSSGRNIRSVDVDAPPRARCWHPPVVIWYPAASPRGADDWETLQDGLLSLSLPSLLCSPAQHEFAQENRLTVFGWTLDGEVILELRPCGDSRCGKVVWLKQPLGPEGLPLRDYRNSDPNLRSRPVCGLEVVSGFKKQSDSSWGGGTVYVSDQGTSYSGVAKVLSPTKVEVTGYIGLPIFGASEVWTKVSRPPEICSDKGT